MIFRSPLVVRQIPEPVRLRDSTSAWPLIADLLLLRAWMVVQPFRLDVMDLANGCDYYVRHGGDDKRTEDLALMILHIDGKR
jgi:hypothetical protein